MANGFVPVLYGFSCILILFSLSSCSRIRRAEDRGYFWHVTDMHWDPTYTQEDPGGSCGEGAVDKPLGEYGDYLCDAPWKLINSSVYAMRELGPEPDFLIWTGDDTPHIWNDTILNQEAVYIIIKDLTDILMDVFPEKMVYSAIGNHDWSPKNQLPPHQDQFYDRIADLWADWLPDQANDTFRRGAYYSLVGEKAQVRIIVLNTNLYYQSNELTDGMHDPAHQLQWMDDVITKANEDGEQVMLVAHVPPGKFEKHEDYHWFYPLYNEAFIRLVRKHADTIGSVHMAHHHTDSFRLLYDEEGDPVVSMFLGPAVTPWETTLPGVIGGAANNPSIRRVEYDRRTGEILDIIQYYLNLTEANQKGMANWTVAYKATEYFGIPNLTPESLDDFAQDWLTKSDQFDKYYKINGVLYDPNEKCEGECMFVHYCAATKLDYDDYSSCMEQLKAEASTALTLVPQSILPSVMMSILVYHLFI